MVNYICTPKQRLKYEFYREEFAKKGFFLNAGVYFEEDYPKKEEQSFYENYLPFFDLKYKLGLVSPRGKRCMAKARCLTINWNGDYDFGCGRRTGNAFESIPDLNVEPATCDKEACACIDMYSLLDESHRGINALEEYATECKCVQRFRLFSKES